jgi:hypothetical protein
MFARHATEHRLRLRYTDLLQARAQRPLTPEEQDEFAVLRATLNALEAPIYAQLASPPAAAPVGA